MLKYLVAIFELSITDVHSPYTDALYMPSIARGMSRKEYFFLCFYGHFNLLKFEGKFLFLSSSMGFLSIH